MSAVKRYLIALAVGFGLAAYLLWQKDIFAQTDTATIFHILCDAFFVPGVLLVCFGLLIFTTNEGTFDGMTYAVKSFVNMFRKQNLKKFDSYYDYKASRKNRDTKFGYLVICGLFFIAVSLVMLYFNMQYR